MNKKILTLLIYFIMPICFANEEFVNPVLNNSEKIYTNTIYNYESTEKIPIKMTFVEKLGTEKDVYEGEVVHLKLLKSVVWKDKTIAEKDSLATAKIGIIISTGMNGIPASVILEDFKISDIPQKKLTETFEIFGQDRSLLVFPLKWALTFLPPTGSLTNFIMGGHVKLKPKKIITVYYYPEWE